jgi:iron(III) transport system permease protein
MVLVEGLHLAPLVFLLMAAAFRSLDPALEEAAVASGARRLMVLRRVTLPLLRPALLAGALITIVRAIESFEVPALIGIPDGTWVLTSRIWQAFDRVPPDLGAAGAYSFSLLVVTAVGVLAYARFTRGERRFETIGGRAHRPARIELGRWRTPLTAALLAYLTVASLLPLLLLTYGSLQPVYSKFALDGLDDLTLRHYSDALSDDGARDAFGNSFVLGIGTATAVMLVTAIVAWMVVRSRARGRWLLDATASLPLVVPGLVLGVALLFVWLRSPLPVYGTLWILAIAYFTRFMPHGMRFSVASMHQIGGELEEAARTSGASWWASFRRVVLPLALPGLAAGWIYVFILSMRELSATILLYSPGTETVSILIWNAYNDSLLAGMAATGMLLVLVLAALAAVAYLLFTRAQRTLDAHG